MNPYEVLGVDSVATPATIKKAYRKLAAKHHPDRGGDAERFKEVQAAYECLSDPIRRRRYDETGDSANPGAAGIDPSIVVLHQLLQQAMAQIDVDRVHLIEAMRSGVKVKRDEFVVEKAAIETRRARIERTIKRVTKKSGENKIAAMLRTWIAHLPQQEQALQENIETCDKLLNELEDYGYELPEVLVNTLSSGQNATFGSVFPGAF